MGDGLWKLCHKHSWYEVGCGVQARAHAAGQMGPAGSIARTNSGLQSMQSIEHALGTVEHDIMDKVADDWMAQPHHGNTTQAQGISSNLTGVPGFPPARNERQQSGMSTAQHHSMRS